MNRGGTRDGNDILFYYNGTINPVHVSYVYNTLNEGHAIVDIWSSSNYRRLFFAFTGQKLSNQDYVKVCNIRKKTLLDPIMNSLADIVLKGIDGILPNFHDL